MFTVHKGQLRTLASIVLMLITIWGARISRASDTDKKSSKPSTTRMQDRRPFTVAESIAMTHFEEPREHTKENPPVSPDGKRYLVVTERGVLESNVREYTLLVYQLEQGDEPQRIASFRSSSNRPGIAQARWIDTQRISLIGENAGEFPQVYVVDCRTRKRRKLTNAPNGVVTYDISIDLKTLAYYAYWAGNAAESKIKEDRGFAITDENLANLVNGTWKHPEYVFEMFLLNVPRGKLQRVRATPFRFSAETRLRIWLSPDGRYAVTEQGPLKVPAIWQDYDEPSISKVAREEQGRIRTIRLWGLEQIMLVDTRTAELTPLLDAPISNTAMLTAAWSSDSHSVVVAGTLLPLDTKDRTELARRKTTPVIAEVAVPGRACKRVVDLPKGQFWQIRAGDVANTFLIDAWETDIWKQLPTQQFRRQGEQWTHDASHVDRHPGSDIAVAESLNSWPKLVKTDPVTNNERTILDPNPQLGNIRFGREVVIHWTGKRGEPLIGGLLYPTDYIAGVRYPLVIQTHGFAVESFLPDGPFTTVFAGQELANKGIVVLQIGHSSLYYQAFGTLDFGPVEVSQIESAIDYLDDLGAIDRERVGLVGFSMTGFQVTYALAHSKYHFAAATSAEGNDWGYWSYVDEANSPVWATQSERPYGGPPWNDNWKTWMEDSITFNYDKIHTPLRLESDTNDIVAEVLNEWEKFIALKRLHKPVELIYLSHGAHPVVKPWDRMTSQQGNIDWLLFWLKGEEDSDPTKAEQYQRWKEMKDLSH
jgi:dipeptidyl aminopeptidase/acylaminoacyl peptidase